MYVTFDKSCSITIHDITLSDVISLQMAAIIIGKSKYQTTDANELMQRIGREISLAICGDLPTPNDDPKTEPQRQIIENSYPKIK